VRQVADTSIFNSCTLQLYGMVAIFIGPVLFENVDLYPFQFLYFFVVVVGRLKFG